MFNLSGKVALITGASRGFGREFARVLSEAGADLALVARSREGLEEPAAMVQKEGQRVFLGQADISKSDEVEAVVTKAVADLGKIDILINNAGILIRHKIEEFNNEDWEKVIQTNLYGRFYCIRAVAPLMKQQKWGRIINIGSLMGEVALAERTAYCASKAGLHGMTKALALELVEHNITVNAIAPGIFLTDITKAATTNPEVKAFYTSRIPQGRLGEPSELGPLVLYLASEESAYVTGTVLSIDGGWTAQ